MYVDIWKLLKWYTKMKNRLNYKRLFADEIEMIEASLPKKTNKGSIVMSLIYQLIISCLLILYSFISKEIIDLKGKKIAVSRSKTGISVIKKVYDEEVNIIYDFGIKKPLLRYLQNKNKIEVFADSLIDAIKVIRAMHYDEDISSTVYLYYRFRIAHYCFYINTLKMLAVEYKFDAVISPQIIDRFAFGEKEVTKVLKIQRLCIPHGLEPLNRLPFGFPADIFYCHSNASADYLKRMYQDSCYLYSSQVIKKLMSFNKKPKKIDKIVFFTQPYSDELTKYTIEYIEFLIEYVKKSEYFVEVFIKLHPSENKEKYTEILKEIKVIDDISEAVSSMVCISFFSTCLVEALYNNSYSISIEENRICVPVCEVNINPEIRKVKSVYELREVLDCFADSNKNLKGGI